MDLRKEATKVARKYAIPEEIFFGLIEAESNWNPKAISRSGAAGLTQVMPQTARAMGFKVSGLAADPLLQLEAGAKYLREMFTLFQDWEKALAAYNAGPHNVEKHGGIPPFPSTRKYVQRVLQLAREHAKEKFSSPFAKEEID